MENGLKRGNAPVPVLALAITSPPLRMTGSVASWTLVIWLKPSTSDSARWDSAVSGRSLNCLSLMCTERGAPEDAGGALLCDGGAEKDGGGDVSMPSSSC